MKTNRVHKGTGLIAVHEYGRCYYTVLDDGISWRIPTEIVEGEGWEEEKSEIDSVANFIHDFNGATREEWIGHAKNIILEFAKNYKEPKP